MFKYYTDLWEMHFSHFSISIKKTLLYEHYPKWLSRISVTAARDKRRGRVSIHTAIVALESFLVFPHGKILCFVNLYLSGNAL